MAHLWSPMPRPHRQAFTRISRCQVSSSRPTCERSSDSLGGSQQSLDSAYPCSPSSGLDNIGGDGRLGSDSADLSILRITTRFLPGPVDFRHPNQLLYPPPIKRHQRSFAKPNRPTGAWWLTGHFWLRCTEAPANLSTPLQLRDLSEANVNPGARVNWRTMNWKRSGNRGDRGPPGHPRPHRLPIW